ncbi:probable DNA double-strand break repair Rad50 ATPase [Topomyia yanbarensis]|uniref:probable DNA double-strand break repair Rad50 ATPase n=1 Tax=Topomyia yanbarensis TaxID=2498891 RepID=UPI00273CC624|nr:probable DNA double-strand break repair Rad50 ATPase [Topomyia yanbarensis]
MSNHSSTNTSSRTAKKVSEQAKIPNRSLSQTPSSTSDDEPITGIISKLDDLENTISNLELDVRKELNTQRLLSRCQLNLAAKCAETAKDPSALETQSRRPSGGSAFLGLTECNCRCHQALVIYLDQLRQAKLEQEELLRHLKMKEEQLLLYRSKMLEMNSIVEHQKQQLKTLKENEVLVTQKINSAVEKENQMLMQEINRLKQLPDELREREQALKFANKELQETKLTLKSLLLDIESGLEACEGISGELQQERTRAFNTLTEIDQEKRKVLNWVDKYTSLKEEYDSAVKQKQSNDQLMSELRLKTTQLEEITRQYDALKEESTTYMARMQSEYDKQEAELNKRAVDMECENHRLKVTLEDQSTKASSASHNMQRELLSLEMKFNEAQNEIDTLKRYNEAAAAAAEYGVRKKNFLKDESSSTETLSPPFCSLCAVEQTAGEAYSCTCSSNESESVCSLINEEAEPEGSK